MMVFKFLSKDAISKPASIVLLLALLVQLLYPTTVIALTNGPSQPEVQSFEPISTTEMVDVFTGDFKYNIPLLDIEGYPINIAYASGISTDQEASWTGLGWNLNVGSVNRAMRGLPDDFKGEEIKKEFNMKPNRTYGISVGVDMELFGKKAQFETINNVTKLTKKGKLQKKLNPKISLGANLSYNNYTGFGLGLSSDIGISAAVPGKGQLDASLGLHTSANGGLEITPNLSYEKSVTKTEKKDLVTTSKTKAVSGGMSATINSRVGLKEIGFKLNYTKKVEKSTDKVESSAAQKPSLNSRVRGLLKNFSGNSSKGVGGSINFGVQTYVPQISMPMVNNSISLTLKTGATMFGHDGNLTLGAYYSGQKLKYNQRTLKAWGYLYSEYGQNDMNALMDFNREKDGSFTRNTKNLPITNFTYDVYSATAQGAGGTYRPFRSDIGHVFDNRNTSESNSFSLGFESNFGNLLKAGLNVSFIDVNNSSGKWKKDNGALDYFQFKNVINDPVYEPFYFKQVGEKGYNSSNNTLYNSVGGEDAFAIRFKQGGGIVANNAPIIKSVKELEKFPKAGTSLVLNPTNNVITDRQIRNQPFTTLTRVQSAQYGLQPNLYNNIGIDDIDNSNNKMKIFDASNSVYNHHIAEVSVLGMDGKRYYYGLPVYNTKTKEVTFNVAGNQVMSNGLVNYSSNDATKFNNKGTDNFYSSSELPPYAYSYLLTAIVSDDYIDMNSNGPDDADAGTYTKFHYKKPSTSNYKWRMPIDISSNNPVANFNQNCKSNDQDDQANYTYGEKELYYLDEIQTNHYLAKFITSDRDDSYGVVEQGNQKDNSVKSKKLDKIVLYSKAEYLLNGVNAEPIKTVYFEYDYELCQGTTNSNAVNQGKLTLQKIYFTYGKSNRAIFNAYGFDYSTFNPVYHNKAYDRWGNYKQEVSNVNGYLYNSAKTNAEFPFVEQDNIKANQNASAWHLTKISLPTGGEINIEYESDDYAYVQNMPAGQMFDILGCSNFQPFYNSAYHSKLFDYNLGSGYFNYSYLVVDGISPSVASTNAEFKNYFLKDVGPNGKKLFFRFLVNLRNQNVTVANATSNFLSNMTNNFYEYVPGYADVEDAGLILNGTTPTGKAWIKIKDAPIKGRHGGPTINPIALASIQYGRLNYGAAVYDYDFNPPADIEAALKQMASQVKGAFKSLLSGFKNPNKVIADKEYCKYFQPNKSMVRLYNGESKRFGGGSRVKRISLNDNWSTMTNDGTNPSQASTIYGQEYDYTTTDEFGRVISSGVATYEPMVGNEENTLKQPFYLGKNKWTLLAPDDDFYVEGPFGESFYPSPSIGYSKVKVSNIFPTNATNNYKDGYKIFEFYTAKDYPTIAKHTPIIPKQHRNPLKSVLKIYSRDYISASQGYVIKLNDMHGKQKSERDYANGKIKPEKSVEYYYKSKGGSYKVPQQRSLSTDASYTANELDNKCTILKKDGSIAQAQIGIDFDAIADFRESETETISGTAQLNAVLFLLGIVPTAVPTVWPSGSFERSRFRSAVLTKVINQYAILEKTTITIDDSMDESENLAYDAVTGEPLVTKSKNDFNDPIYNVKLPAYWGYDLMGSAYKNLGLHFNLSGSNGVFTLSQANLYFNPGDEVYAQGKRYTVCNVTNGSVSLIDQNANYNTIPNNIDVTIIRSGRRNLLNHDMGVLTSLNNPISGSALVINANTKVIDAKSKVYSDKWQAPAWFNTNNNPVTGNCLGPVNSSCAQQTSVQQTALFVQSLINNPSNNLQGTYPSAFFNGALTNLLPNNSLNPNNFVINNSFSTFLYKDPTYIGTNGPTWLNNYSSGFDLTYAINNSILSQIPQNQPGNNYACGQSSNMNLLVPAYLMWSGPGQNGANPFNTNGQIIGCFNEPNSNGCGNFGTICLDFRQNTNNNTNGNINPQVAFNWSTLQAPYTGQDNQTFYKEYLQNIGLPGPRGIKISILPGRSLGCANAFEAEFWINTLASGMTLFYSPVIVSSTCLNCTAYNNCPMVYSPVLPAPTSANTPPVYNTQNQICSPWMDIGVAEQDYVNPYYWGIRGNWRLKSSFSFVGDRFQSPNSISSNANTNIRNDGYYLNFNPMYSPNGSQDWSINFNNWLAPSEVTIYNSKGVEIETKDALGRYSSALYGYGDGLPVAVSSNAKLQEIAFDGFEDYNYLSVCSSTSRQREYHFKFLQGLNNIVSTEAHTGKYSMKVLKQSSTQLQKSVLNNNVTSIATSNCAYFVQRNDVIYPFSPLSSSSSAKDYVISYWVKEDYTGTKPLDYTHNSITVTQGASGPAFQIKNYTRSTPIDGWQRVEYAFTIPQNYVGPLSVNLNNTSATMNAYFDDVRIHPFNSSLKSFVYDPVNLKYRAELDANNYATFYEYDEQGNLIRVKKETEKGIMTIKESKTHHFKN